jgi:hypothetical protein
MRLPVVNSGFILFVRLRNLAHPKLLENGKLAFWCIQCDDSWTPSDDEKRTVQNLLRSVA